jgi:hypothetical protein
MPIQINCPSCIGAVRVPEELLGKRVQCPRCEAKFVAEADDEDPLSTPATAEQGEDTGRPLRPRRHRPPEDYDDDYYDDYDDRPRRRSGRPHRGGIILTLGVCSLLLCAPLGIFAWVMGNHDLTEMKRGRMDRSGEGLTQAGRILGSIATILMIVGCVAYTAIVGFALMAH